MAGHDLASSSSRPRSCAQTRSAGGDGRPHPSAQGLAQRPRVPRRDPEAALAHAPSGSGSSRTRWPAPPARSWAARPVRASRPGGHALERRQRRPGPDQVGVQAGERGLLQADHAGQRLLEQHVFVGGVRRVVGGDHRDRSVSGRRDERGASSYPQRQVHLQIRVERPRHRPSAQVMGSPSRSRTPDACAPELIHRLACRCSRWIG